MRRNRRNRRIGFAALSVICALCGGVPAPSAAASNDEHNLLELRDTVINLIQALVQRGVITKEQAEKMIADAKVKAESEVAANEEKQKAQEQQDQGAVRVPYVPQIVKDEIRKEVVQEMAPGVKQQVAEQLNTPGTISSALPDWVQRMRWTGDVRMRGEADNFAAGNASGLTGGYLNFLTVNQAGGVEKAGSNAFMNTTEDVDRLRLRLRFGFDVDLGDGFSSGMRLATGSGGQVFASTNQTLGTYGDGYQIALDQGWIRWTGAFSSGEQILSATAGRFANPWVSTNMEWYNDLTFEGVMTNYRFNISSDNSHRHDFYATVGAFPLQSESPSSEDKWLLAGQLGADFLMDNDSRYRVGAAYYDYVDITGRRNAPETTFYNYTAPPLLQHGNTLFDISNTTDTSVNLFALAGRFRIVDLIAIADWPVFSGYSVSLTGNAVRNIGFNWEQVLARTGTYVAPRTSGYEGDVGFGSYVFGPRNSWRASVGYRYLQRDAVLDAFNDEDWHLGGTDMRGYQVILDYSVNPRVWARLKYMSANAIDLPKLGIDVLQLDLNTQF